MSISVRQICIWVLFLFFFFTLKTSQPSVSGITGGGGAGGAPQRLLTGKVLLMYREKVARKKELIRGKKIRKIVGGGKSSKI